MNWYSIILRHCLWGLCLIIPVVGYAQSAEEPNRNIVTFSPVELFYKTQIGYERALTSKWSIGSTAAYHHGFQDINLGWERYRGWQVTTFARRAFSDNFPIGFYNHAQLSLFNHTQRIDLTNTITNEYVELSYRGLGAGLGAGIGYRRYLWASRFHQRLLLDGLVGGRYQHRPTFTFDQSEYHKSLGLLGNGNEFGWVIGPSPGSIFFGQLALGYTL